MQEYFRKSSGLDRTLYRKVKYILADYDRMKRERLNILYGSGDCQNGMPRGSGVGNPTERRAEKLAAIDDELLAIDQACAAIREAYKEKTYEEFDPLKAYWSYDYFNYMHLRTERNPEGPVRRTWNRYKDCLTRLVAEKLNFI